MNDQDPLVSVIIPAYKAEEYLPDALRSLGEQTYPHWEAMVVEDAWRDRSEEIVQEFAAQVPRNRVQFLRHEENQGLGATRNTAIRASQGEYVALLDHDDVWQADHLSAAVPVLAGGGADLVYCTAEMFEDSTERITGTWGPTPEELEAFPVSLYLRNFVTPSTSVMRRSNLEAVGLFDSLRRCEDYDCWLKMLRAGSRFAHLEPPTCFYRKHPGALTSNYRSLLEAMVFVLERHADWPVLPRSVRRARLAGVWSELAAVSAGEQPGRAAGYLLRALRQQPGRVGMQTILWLNRITLGRLFGGRSA